MTAARISVVIEDLTYSGQVLLAEEYQDYDSHGIYRVNIEYPQTVFGRASGGIRIHPDNALATVTVGGSAETDTWFGSVHHHEVISAPGSETVVVEYVLIGTSRALDFNADRRWTNTSVSAVVRDIISSRGFRSIVSQSSLVLPYVASGTSTDFELLKAMGERAGYRIAARNATIHFVDPRIQVLGNDTGRVFPFGQQKSPTSNDTLYSFKILAGSDLPGASNRQSTYSGVNRQTQSVITATGAATGRDTIRKSMQVDTIGQAQQAALADDLRSRFWVTSEIVVDGSSTMGLGDLVDLSGNAVPPLYRGTWAVRSTARTYKRGADRLLNTVTLERNQPNGLTYDKTVTLPNRSTNGSLALRDGKWVAAIREDFTVG